MSLFDDLFGGVNDSAQVAALNQNAAVLQRTAELTERARDDAIRLFPSSQNALKSGYDKAADVYKGGTDANVSAVQQGSDLARQMKLLGLSGFESAIMGNPQSFSAADLLAQYQAQPKINVDTSFMDQTMPQMVDPTALGIRSDPTYGGEFPGANGSEGSVTDTQRAGIQEIYNRFANGEITEAQGTQEVIAKANELGLDLGQLSYVLGMTPQTILDISNQYSANLNNTGDRLGVAATQAAERDHTIAAANQTAPQGQTGSVSSPAQAVQQAAPEFNAGDRSFNTSVAQTITDPNDQWAANQVRNIALEYFDGEIGIDQASKQLYQYAKNYGFSDEQIASLTGTPVSEVTKRFNLIRGQA